MWIRVTLVSLAVFAAACGKAPTAMDVCNHLESAGVASNCRNGTPGGLGAAAVEDAEFDLPSVPGHGGMVLRFDKDETYDRTVDSFSKAAMLAGPYRYGARKARIFVQMNDGASAEIGAKAKAVVDAVSGGAGSASPATALAVAIPPPQPSSSAPSPAPAASAQVAPTAMDACSKLEAAGVAKECQSMPATNGATAAGFKFVGWPGPSKEGLIMHPPTDEGYQKLAATPLATTQKLYGSARARVLVGPTKGMPADLEKRTKAVVDAL